ncbi:hypothetical protein [Bradyrhizobium lablabi]|uniref:hypothetical protein n=1 Tax=Bradyrhizobium lablabi TaxID=722472 RepID=UPI001BAD3F36|nr:hypothetical protein [Bradyrhizobium lablabi]MBR0696897.1 hypothetical protein [Bradyrhizobium lablabi]
MHPAAKLQFARIVDEFVRWRTIPEPERPPAPAWWWGPALGMHEITEALPAAWCRQLGLADGATCNDGAELLCRTLSGQTVLPWPYDFSRKVASADSDVRDLHVQPLDDGAFPP